MSGRPSWSLAETFRFVSRDYDPSTGVARLCWGFDDGEPLTEEICFPYAPWPQETSRQAAFLRALEILHLVAGISYYKTCLPPNMDCGDCRLDPHSAGFLNQLYVRGLGEFAWVNQVDVAARVNFQATEASGPDPITLDLPDRALVAMGGGKDSLVSLECLKAAGIEQQPVCVGASTLIGETVARSGLPLLRIDRVLSPRLIQMNSAGALNGHVPVTAINSAILMCAAVLYGYRWVVFSNERSASEATRQDGQGGDINHQYSKSFEFEQAFADFFHHHVSPDIGYFSLLRPLAELAVAKKFSELQQYHDVFSSCNRNFHLDGSRIKGRWCGDCPKCRFTCLALALFMAPAELVSIQEIDLLDRESQQAGFRALCGLGEDKPFECVGTLAESRAAMQSLIADPRWREKAVLRALAPELRALEAVPLETCLLPDGPHRIPETLWRRCRAFF
jgi:hypothetical protein